jgi:hypothetical protein
VLGSARSMLLAKICRDARTACGPEMSQEKLGAALGRRQQAVAEHESAAHDRLPNIDDMMFGPRAYALHLATEVCAMHGAVVVTGPTIVRTCPQERLAHLLRELSEALVSQHARAHTGSTADLERNLHKQREARAALDESIAADTAELLVRRRSQP